ncbi:hypothetical protein WJM95_15700 [Streptomyces sp. f51]|uniref:hypothetical protein n=1 Tax=Streptomyces sp. f51 TaxID=1827742 RepID=UPI0030D42A1E
MPWPLCSFLGWGSVGPQLLRAFHTVVRPAAPVSLSDRTEAQPEETPSDPVPATTPPTVPAEPITPMSTLVPLALRTAPAPASPAVKVPEPLLAEARSIAASHHAEHSKPITAAQLKTRLGIGLPMATALHAAL